MRKVWEAPAVGGSVKGFNVGEATLKHTPIDRLEREAVLIRIVEVLVLEVKCFNAKLWHAGSGPGIRPPSPKRARSWLKWKIQLAPD